MINSVNIKTPPGAGAPGGVSILRKRMHNFLFFKYIFLLKV